MVLNLARIPSDSILESATLAEQNRNSILRFQAMGSVCRIVCPELKNLVEFFKEALEWVARFEKKYSRFIPDSLVSRINAKAGDREWIEVDGETETLLRLCEEAHFLTRGTFDPTALPLINLWDWKRPRSALPTDAEVRAALEKVGWRRFERAPGQVRLTQPGMSLDLGGIGKEYAVDRIVAMAKIRGIHNILVDFGRDIHAAGHPQDGRLFWNIGVEDPQNPDHCRLNLSVSDLSVACSGDYHRKFEFQGKRYGHIVDIRTGFPVDHEVRSVTVVANRCTVAGLLATSAFILGPKEGLHMLESFPGAAGLLTCKDRTLQTREFQRYVLP